MSCSKPGHVFLEIDTSRVNTSVLMVCVCELCLNSLNPTFKLNNIISEEVGW